VSPEEFRVIADVSRETLVRFESYAGLLAKWQRKINLISNSTLDDIWGRHFWDSAQLGPLAPSGARIWLDLGSGAGFPGLVLSIMGAPEVHLVESDSRKAAFLREAARISDSAARVHAVRAESLAPFRADVITSRALASVNVVLKLAAPFCSADTTILLLKSDTVESELTEARRYWKIAHVEILPSRSNPSGRILRLRGIRHEATG